MSGVTVTMQSYNEKSPFGKSSKHSDVAVIGGDNIEFSRIRYEAIQAVKRGQATPEQRALVTETDTIIQEALGGGEEE